MIYTVTFNPSLDYTISVPQFGLGKTNRTSEEQMLAGGKGINVSTVLNNLGIETTALGFIAGFTGQEIQRMVIESGLPCAFIPVSHGISRINIKMKNYADTEINGQGPMVGLEELQLLMRQLNQLQSGDMVVLAGSISPGLSPSVYRDIMAELEGKGVSFVVDATGQLLLSVMEYHPFLVKPNHHELGALFQVTLETKEDVVVYAKKLQTMGAKNVLISMASEGAVLVAETGEVYMAQAPEGKLVNGIGAGDSMVAGFLAGWITSHDYGQAFRMGLAAGSASAFSHVLASKEEIMELLNRI